MGVIFFFYVSPQSRETKAKINKYDYIKYYSTIKINKILPFGTACLDLEGIMLSEINQSEKDKSCVISLICEMYKTKQMNQHNKTETEA